MSQKLLRLLGCILVAWVTILPSSFGQQRSPFKNLIAAANNTVRDTISGIDLDVNEASPQPQHGSLDISVISAGGSGVPYVFEVAYTPDTDFIGVDTFVLEYRYASTFPYQVYQGFRVAVKQSIVRAGTDFSTTMAGTPVVLNVLSNDNSDWAPLTLSAIPAVNNGTAAIVAGNQLEFTPEAGFTGIAHVTYVVCDALNSCQTATAHIGVNNGLPDTDSLLVFTKKNQPLTFPLEYEGYSIHQGANNGTVELFSGRACQYVPNPGYHGNDAFVLKVQLGGIEYYKTIRVRVINAAAPNNMAVDDVVFTPKNQAVTFNVRNNDVGNLLVRHWSVPANFPGTISGNSGSGNVTFTPNNDFSGVATFSYKLGNSSATALETATVTVVVDDLGLPPIHFPYRMMTPKETPFVVHYEVPYQDFDFILVNMPLHGDLELFPGITTQVINGQSVTGNNLVVYTPDAGFEGEDGFALAYCAPNGACSSTRVELDVVSIAGEAPPFCVSECAWPGDLNADHLVNNKDLLPLGFVMGQSGAMRTGGSTDWYGQYANNWQDPFSELHRDVKFTDGNGNGEVEAADITAIEANYNRAHNLFPKSYALGKGLPFGLELLEGNPNEPGHVVLQVSLGTEAVPAVDVYGFTFDITLSPGLVDTGFSARFYTDSWLTRNEPSIALAQRPYTGRFETAFTRTNGKPASGIGPIGVVDFVVIDIIDGGDQNSRPTVTLHPSVMLADGTLTDGEPIVLDLPIKPTPRTSIAQSSANTQVTVMPVPAQDRLYVSWQGEVSALSLQTIQGQTLLTAQASGSQTMLDVAHLPAGMYWLTLQTAKGPVSKKVQIMR
jgi:hypothetical protein